MHPAKAPSPMFVTDLGMVTDVRPVHPEKAKCPIVETVLGIVTEVRLVQPLKTMSLIAIIPSGITKSLTS